MLCAAAFGASMDLVAWLCKPLWRIALVGGMGNVGAYGLVLWAMTKAPVAAVAALRETSILFAALVGIFILNERADKYRLGATVFIVAGAIVLRLG